MTELTQSPTWQSLAAHRSRIADFDLAQLFAADAKRFDKLSLSVGDMLLDYSKNLVDAETMKLLVTLARERHVGEQMLRMFRGERINSSENRAVLHAALRSKQPVLVDGVDVMPQIGATFDRMAEFCNAVRDGTLRAVGGERFTDVISIGIGGSHLGPALAARALADYADAGLRVHFVSNVDGAALVRTLAALDPATTLVIVISKTFTTIETLLNARSVRDWMSAALGGDAAAAKQFAAVTANIPLAVEFGITTELVFPFWDWIGGRYSMWSAVGLPLALVIGMPRFREMLDGAHAMDEHFRNAAFEKNMPVVLALLAIWYGNFLGAQTHGVIPYDDALALLPAYLQQLDMESSGKATTAEGKSTDYDTGLIIWGAAGTDAQHSFFQLLHQGTRLVSLDFIGVCEPQHDLGRHHAILMANFFAQTAALMNGETSVLSTSAFPGNRPSTTIMIRKLTPAALGMLIALYEHKVFVQNTIWGINAFDQPGVELGKKLATRILPDLESGGALSGWDASTQGLVDFYRRNRG